MSLVPVKYPLDRTGSAVTNLVADEPHVLANANYRVLVPKHGAFFSKTLIVREAATGRELKLGVDYYPAMLYATPTMDTGLAVHQLIVITNPAISPNVLFTAQMLGGEYSYSWDAIMQLIQSLRLDQRSVLFENIIGLPESFTPAPHLHDAGDIFGFEFQVAALERITQAVRMGSGAQLKAILQYLDAQVAEVYAKVDAKLGQQGSAQGIIKALGFTPINKGGDTFDGPMRFNKGITNVGFFKEKRKRITATTNTTTLDLSLAGNFEVILASSTTFKFDLSKIEVMEEDDVISFVLAVQNDGTAGRAIAFAANVNWADKTIPPRSTGANARDEFYFSSFDGGVTWTGSLSNVNVGRATN